jgi:hypothetical protein
LLVVTQVVTYRVDDSTKVMFEVDPVPGFVPAGAGQIVGRVRDAVGPAVDAARAVLDKVKEIGLTRSKCGSVSRSAAVRIGWSRGQRARRALKSS